MKYLLITCSIITLHASMLTGANLSRVLAIPNWQEQLRTMRSECLALSSHSAAHSSPMGSSFITPAHTPTPHSTRQRSSSTPSDNPEDCLVFSDYTSGSEDSPTLSSETSSPHSATHYPRKSSSCEDLCGFRTPQDDHYVDYSFLNPTLAALAKTLLDSTEAAKAELRSRPQSPATTTTQE